MRTLIGVIAQQIAIEQFGSVEKAEKVYTWARTEVKKLAARAQVELDLSPEQSIAIIESSAHVVSEYEQVPVGVKVPA